MTMTKPDPAIDRIVPCPNCGKATRWGNGGRGNGEGAKNPYRPFCSERCRLIDLGEWASGRNHIPGDADHADINSDDLGDD